MKFPTRSLSVAAGVVALASLAACAPYQTYPSAGYPSGGYPAGGSLLPDSFLELDPPDHTRLRRLAMPAFSPKKIDEYRARVEKVSHVARAPL